MESFWKGSFAYHTNSIKKHVKNVQFVSIQSMTQADWDILDYEMLRPSARENLDTLILAGGVTGFFQVTMDLHKAHSPHGGKEKYL